MQVAETRAELSYCEAQRVTIAVQVHAEELLRVSRRRTLFPDRLARARPIDPAPLGDGTRQRFARAPNKTERAARLVADHGRPHLARQRLRKRRCDSVTQRKPARVQRHADLCIGSQAIELGNFGRGRDSTGGSHPCSGRGSDDSVDSGAVEPAHLPLFFHLREEEATNKRRELANTLQDRDTSVRSPPVHDDLAASGIQGGDDPLTWQRAAEIRRRSGADHHLCRARIEPATGAVEIADPSADATRRPAHEISDQLGIRTPTERGIQIHDGHVPCDGEFLQSRDGIAAVEHEVLAAAQLHRASRHDVDTRYDHRRTPIPRIARSVLMPSTVSWPS